jgi:hypothetical protein
MGIPNSILTAEIQGNRPARRYACRNRSISIRQEASSIGATARACGGASPLSVQELSARAGPRCSYGDGCRTGCCNRRLVKTPIGDPREAVFLFVLGRSCCAAGDQLRALNCRDARTPAVSAYEGIAAAPASDRRGSSWTQADVGCLAASSVWTAVRAIANCGWSRYAALTV